MSVNRTLPSAPEAEASLLGTMMFYPTAARTAMEEGLSEEDFFVEANRLIFLAIQKLYRSGTPIDVTTVSTQLSDEGNLQKCGGMPYLTGLTKASVTSANTKNYVKIIHDRAMSRKMIETAYAVAEEGFESAGDIDDYLDDAEKRVLSVSRSRRTSEFQNSTELMNNVLGMVQKMSDNKSSITGLKTGFRELDRTLHGLQRSDFLVLAARPSMGKTAVALNIAMQVAEYPENEGAVAIFSLEMAAEQLGLRLLAAKSKVDNNNIRTGYLNGDEWNRVNEAASQLQGLKMYYDSTPGIKVSEIFSKCRRLQADQGLALIVIDYIQLIEGSGTRRSENRQQEVSEISRNLKSLARELNVPVLALSQLGRGVEQRENKRPLLSDLRESGAIEQDADVVMMLYRDAYYNQELKEQAQKDGQETIELDIAKHRNGATKKIYFSFQGSTTSINDIEFNREEQM